MTMKTERCSPVLMFVFTLIFSLLASQDAAAESFVDIVYGTDDPAYGTTTGTGAWKTLHYAIQQINGLPSGATIYTLNVAAGTYSIANGEDDSSLAITQDNFLIQGVSGASRPVIDGTDGDVWDQGLEISGSSGVTVQDLQIQNFSSSGIYIFHSSPLIQRNILHQNGDGIGINSDYMEVSPYIWNNLITSSSNNGIEVFSMGAAFYPNILHNTIDGSGYGGIYLENYYEYGLIEPTIAGNIIVNSGDYGIYNEYSDPIIFYNDVWNSGTSNYIGISGVTLDISADPLFSSVTDYDYRLQSGSPCIDAFPLDSSDPVIDDLSGATRPLGSGYDMGCFEVLPGVPLTGGDYFVDIVYGTDDILNGGASGVSAWKTLHYAIQQINGGLPSGTTTYTLNVAAGTYSIANGEANSSLQITQDNVLIQGASGATRPVIDGTGGDGWYQGITISGTSYVTVQDLQIQNFNDGIYIYDSSPLIQRNILHENYYGISINSDYYIESCSPYIWNNLITSSTDVGIYVMVIDGSSYPNILHNTIDGSESSGIYLDIDYFTYYYGGGSLEPTIAGNIIVNSGDYGINDFYYSSNPTIFYNDVWNSGTSDYNFSGVTLDISADPLFSSVTDYDYRLLSGSPCIDAFPLDSGDPVIDDLSGATRPLGSGYDMGAFEFTSTEIINPTSGFYVNSGNYTSYNVSGAAEASASVEIFTDSVSLGTTTAGVSRTWSLDVDFSPITEGSISLTAVSSGVTSSAVTGTYDRTAPGSIAVPPFYGNSTLSITWTASDATSGVDSTELWYKMGADGTWANTGLTAQPGASGTFSYTPSEGDDTYYFATRSTDSAGNVEAEPTEDGDGSTVFETVDPGSSSVAPFYGNSALSITWTASDATSGVNSTELWYKMGADGTWANTGLTAQPGTSGTFLYTPSEGDDTYYFATRSTDNAGNEEAEPTGDGDDSTIFDTTAPGAATSLSSGSHIISVWSNDNTVDINWTTATDAGGSDLDGYSIVWDTAAATDPDITKDIEEGITSDTSSALANGNSHYFHIRAVDNAGNWGATEHYGPFYIDATGPGLATSLSSSSHTTSVWYNDNTVDINWTTATDAGGSGLDGYSIVWDTASATDPDTIKDIEEGITSDTSSALANGNSHYFHIRAVDNAGNWGATEHYGPFYIDATGPGLATLLSSGSHIISVWYNDNTVDINWTTATDAGGSGLDGYSIVWDETPDTVSGTTKNIEEGITSDTSSALTNGNSHYFHIRAVDNAGNWGATEHYGPFYIDSVDPVSSSAAPVYGNSALSITWVASDSDSDVSLTLLWYKKEAGGAWANTGLTAQPGTSGAFSYTPTDGDGTYYFATQSTDNAGNVEDAPTGDGDDSTIFDTAPPSSIAAPPADGNSILSITWTTSDTASGVASTELWYKKEAGGTWANTGLTAQPGTSGAFSYTPTDGDGTYYFATQSTDNAGNVETAPTGDGDGSTVFDTAPPSSIAVPPANGNSTLSITWTASDATFGVASTELWYKKEAGGTWANTGLAAQLGTSGIFSYTPADGDGTYYFAARSIDNAGNVETAPTGDGDGSTIFDTAPPSSIEVPPFYGNSTLSITWTASDATFGVASTELWYKKEAGGTWANTGLPAQSGTSGAFSYTPTDGDGTYYFATRSTDNAGNVETLSSGVSTVYDTTPPDSGVTLQHISGETYEIMWSALDETSGVSVTQLFYQSGSTNPSGWMPLCDPYKVSSGETTGIFGLWNIESNTIWCSGITDAPSLSMASGVTYYLTSGATDRAENQEVIGGKYLEIFKEVPPVKYSLTMGISGNGSTVPAVGDYDYDESTVVDITAIPDSGWEFDSWTGDVADISSVTTTVTMNSGKTVTALFTEVLPVQYTLTMGVNGNGSTAPAVGDHDYDEGIVVDITAIPDSGWEFDSWTGDVADTSSVTTTVTMNSGKTVTATFTEIVPVQYTLTIGVSGNGSTTPAHGAHDYDEGTVVTVTATPASGWEFVKWTGDVADISSLTTTVTMNSDNTVTAKFIELSAPKHKLTIEIQGVGAVSPFEGTRSLKEGDVALSAVTGEECAFQYWQYSGVTFSDEILMIYLAKDMTIVAVFNCPPDTPYIKPDSVTGSVEDNAIIPSGITTVLLNTSAYSDPENDEYIRSHWQVKIDGSIWNRHDYDNSFDYIANSSVTDVMTEHLVSGITVGLKYYWRVGYFDSGSGVSSLSKEYSFIVGELESFSKPVQSGNQVFDYRVISFPYWPRSSFAEKLFGLTDDPTVFRAGTYIPGSGYIEYGQGLGIKPGRAYWVLSRDPVDMSFSGVSVSTDCDIDVALAYDSSTANGWNQIGVPNNKVYLWKDIQVVQYNPDSGATIFGPTPVYSGVTDSGVSAYIDKRLWKWTGDPGLPYISYDPHESGVTAQLHPYCGYWVKARKPDVFLVFPADAGEPAGLSAWVSMMCRV
jgi:parallel beta-helix repeat protein